MVTRLAGGGSATGVATGALDGTGTSALFFKPYGLTTTSSGQVYVADTWNHLIRLISPTGASLDSNIDVCILDGF